jgi:hypothetical protein
MMGRKRRGVRERGIGDGMGLKTYELVCLFMDPA